MIIKFLIIKSQRPYPDQSRIKTFASAAALASAFAVRDHIQIRVGLRPRSLSYTPEVQQVRDHIQIRVGLRRCARQPKGILYYLSETISRSE